MYTKDDLFPGEMLVLVNNHDILKICLLILLGRCRHSSGNYKAWGASGGKCEAWIVIFHILAAVDRFSWISWNTESH
jgi:hypothetical protein